MAASLQRSVALLRVAVPSIRHFSGAPEKVYDLVIAGGGIAGSALACSIGKVYTTSIATSNKINVDQYTEVVRLYRLSFSGARDNVIQTRRGLFTDVSVYTLLDVL